MDMDEGSRVQRKKLLRSVGIALKTGAVVGCERARWVVGSVNALQYVCVPSDCVCFVCFDRFLYVCIRLGIMFRSLSVCVHSSGYNVSFGLSVCVFRLCMSIGY